MSFFDRFKTKEEKPKKKDEPKKDVKVEKKEKEAAWAASKEKPIEKAEDKPVEESKPAEKTEKPADEPKKKSVRKPKEESKVAEKKKTETKKSDTKTWHITKRTDGMWQVKAQGNERATKLFKTKAEAEEYVKILVANNEGSKVIKHKKTGEFQKK
ncbi:hypothetical protein Mpt1_c06370 [Candidatus Methanoplasma termitum]|uniref:DUF2188 domain-containing protein n=1 Tax=Candidatus Methanoplasma termitum TaxID=1577791 RepID=A0A0A7LDZ4_9ARCH|nr:DUF2188 domain-containing protein [Candidatus Methanoplasma termitum]AIZ56522.1 hypothetical protein Mpt1_c06370 [Candidatus Methanoplasma termitum]MCL2333389.1 DUF2188 domain-containing protein [Candidatus Methanoplasma sp.]